VLGTGYDRSGCILQPRGAFGVTTAAVVFGLQILATAEAAAAASSRPRRLPEPHLQTLKMWDAHAS
jgi:hypothetical protein